MTFSLTQRGTGRDLVLLHGYLSDKNAFAGLIPHLSKTYKVTALDFPGFGNAEPIGFGWSVGDYAAWLKGTLSALSIDRPLVIAHSFGARVAIKANCFEKLALTGCPGIVRHGLKYRVKVACYRLARKWKLSVADSFGSEEYKTLSPVMRESYKKIVNEDLRVAVSKVDRPILFLYGENDETTPVSMGKKLCKKAKDGNLVVLKGCGHFAFLDDPLSFLLQTDLFFQTSKR
ncbi:MAG: alpha/beta hydrolase [Clostridia bacterium]|nr:alpha/beta hydrolase [Clostridia bacterium]